jgi:Tol biopolymer transport system component/serine/threonine protein kinase
MIGDTIGHYRILERLGEGGMGVVYKALDTHLDRLVAIKILCADCVADPDRKRRFVQEAKAASALSHPHIIVVHDIDNAGGADFIAMEYVPGASLAEILRHGRLPIDLVLKYGTQIADALAVAHAAGIVHRDLKPANVMIADKGVAKLLDFGLAKLVEHAPTAAADVTRSRTTVTEAGIVLGTAGYMSPEQAEGRPVDARSDIFSFGALLYEMATGRRAFQGDSPLATLTAVVQQEPPRPDGVPAELERLILRCMRKEADRRMQHMGDVRLALEDMKAEWGSGQASPVRPARRGRRRWLVAAGLLLLTVSAVGLWRYVAPPRAEESISAPVPLTTDRGYEAQAAFSPDGNQVAFVWSGETQDNDDIYVKLIGTETPLRLTNDPAVDVSPAWSPDGRFLAFVRHEASGQGRSAIHVVPAIGGSEKLVGELRTPLSQGGNNPWPIGPYPLVAWTRDGRALLFGDRDTPQQPAGIHMVDLGTGERRRLTTAPDGARGDGGPALSPDGRVLIFSRAWTITRSELFRLAFRLDLRPAGEPERLLPSGQWDSTVVFGAEGRELLFSRGGIYDGPFSIWRVRATPGATPQRLALPDECGWPAYAPSRKRLAFSCQIVDDNIWQLPLLNGAASGPPRKLIASTRDDNVPRYSRDGKRLTFTSNRSGAWQVWVADQDGGNPTQMTSMRGGMTGSPGWSPDGSHIVFDSNEEGQFEVYVIRSAGGAPRRLTNHPADDALASFSSNGRFIYFASNRTGGYQIWRMPMESGEPVQLTKGGGRSPQESPDGRYVYYERSPGPEYWRIDLAERREERVLPSVRFVGAEVTDGGIYFSPQAGLDGHVGLWFYSFATRTTRELLPTTGRLGLGLTVSPDGRALLFTQAEEAGSDLMLLEGVSIR